jgi:hypothetical protein
MSEPIVTQKTEVWRTVSGMDKQLARAVINLMRFHVGRANTIKKPDAMYELNCMGFPLDERQFRGAINCLRKYGVLIGSASSKPRGYWLIASRDEYDEFIEREILSRIKDLRETQVAMDASAYRAFGVKQYSMFGDKNE